MLRLAEEEELENMKTTAMLHGFELQTKGVEIKTSEAPAKKEEDSVEGFDPMGAQKVMPFAFQSPKAYAHLTQEEKEELTQKMMKAHKAFIRQEGILQPKKPRL